MASMAEESGDALIILLQNPNPAAKVHSATLFSSAWSKAYARIGNPYGRIHRDFHYQVMFSALAALAETGCDRLRIDHPAFGTPWREDAYVCLLEASRNLRRHLNPGLGVFLQEGTYDPGMPKRIDGDFASLNLQDHRPVGIHAQVFEGINLRKVFVETATEALTAAGIVPCALN